MKALGVVNTLAFDEFKRFLVRGELADGFLAKAAGNSDDAVDEDAVLAILDGPLYKLSVDFANAHF